MRHLQITCSIFFFFSFWGGVRLSPLGTSALIGLLYYLRMIVMNVDQSVELELAGETEVLGENQITCCSLSRLTCTEEGGPRICFRNFHETPLDTQHLSWARHFWSLGNICTKHVSVVLMVASCDPLFWHIFVSITLSTHSIFSCGQVIHAAEQNSGYYCSSADWYAAAYMAVACISSGHCTCDGQSACWMRVMFRTYFESFCRNVAQTAHLCFSYSLFYK
jgi:hypothetical protein